jgi:MFS family permease
MGRNRDFVIFWIGQTISVLGDAFALVAMPLLVLQATGSIAQMGLVTATAAICRVATGIFAGIIVDNVDRRRLMIWCDIGLALLYGSIPVVWWTHGPQRWLIFVVAGLGGSLGMFFSVSYVAAVANIVTRDHITLANSRLQGSYSVMTAIGPMVAGVVASHFGAPAAVGIDALSFLCGATALSAIRLRKDTVANEPSRFTPGGAGGDAASLRARLLEGARYLFRHPVLRAAAILLGASNMLMSGYVDLIVFKLKHDLHQPDHTVGIVFGVASVGAVVGAVLLPTLRARLGYGACFLGAAAIQGIAILLQGQAETVPTVLMAAPLLSFAGAIRGVSTMTLRQQVTPDRLLGRVTSTFWIITDGLSPLGAAVLTALVQKIGTANVLAISGTGCLILAAIGLTQPVRMRHPERVKIPESEDGAAMTISEKSPE